MGVGEDPVASREALYFLMALCTPDALTHSMYLPIAGTPAEIGASPFNR